MAYAEGEAHEQADRLEPDDATPIEIAMPEAADECDEDGGASADLPAFLTEDEPPHAVPNGAVVS